MERNKLIRKRYFFILVIGIILALNISSMPTSSAASSVSVNTTGNDANSGTAANPYQTISTGINNVDNKGTVSLSKGTFNLNNNVNHTDYGITINKNVTIQGAGSSQTIIDAKGLDNIFTINNSKVIIRDLTIKDGYSKSGGAITNSFGSNLTLINCIVINNIASGFGGAIYNSGTLNITSCTLANNTVTNGYGSAVYNHNGISEIHYNSIFGNNGNAVFSDGGTVNAQNDWWGTNDNPGTELEDFSDINNWTTSSGTKSAVTINGDHGIQVVGSKGSYPGITKTVKYNFNGVTPSLQLWLYLSDLNCNTLNNPSDLIDIGVDLLTASSSKYFEGFLIQSQLHNGLNYIVIPQSQLTPYGGVTWNNTITGLQFTLFYEPGSSMNVTFLELKKNIDGIPRMVLTFDDGYTSVFTTAFPIMQQYGIKGTVYLNTAYVGADGRLTLDQLHQLYNAGWTIANHTPSHTDLTTLTSVDDIKAVIQQGIDWLLANGFTRGAYQFALPFGAYNDKVLEALKECGVQTDRTVLLRMTGIPTDNFLQISQEGPNGDDYPNGENYTTLGMAEKFVDDTIQNKASTFVMMHMIDDSPASGIEWATTDFSNWIAYIAQSGIETETADQWYNDVSGLTFSNVNYSPWIVMNVSASPSSVQTSGTSNITADFTHNSNGDNISALGSIPDGLVVNFSSDSLGTVNPNSSTILNGKAVTMYTAGTTTGTSNVSASANNQTVKTGINLTNTSVPVSVVSTDPVNGTMNVPGNKVMTVIFNVPIKAGSAYSNISVLNNNDNSAKDIVTSISGNTLTITPTYNWLKFVKYTLTIPANSITDLTGNNLITPYIISFTCNNATDTTPPTITSTDPVNNAANVATNKTITVTFSEPIQAGSAYNNIKIMNTSTNTAQTITKTINNNILTITSSAWAQGIKYTLTIPLNSIIDLTGNNLTNTFTSNFTTINTTDTTPPTINNTDPLNNAVNVATNKTITVTFNEPIKAGTSYNNIQIINTSTNTAQTITKTINNNILTITSSAWAQGVLYTLTIPTSSITDLAGNNLTNTFTSNFTTINTTDTTPPTITNTDPLNNAVNVATNKTITVTFNEPIKAGTSYNNIQIINTSTNTAQTITKTINNNILTITSSAWAQGVLYILTIPASSITDLTGNNLTNTFTSNFTTINTTDTTPPTITNTDPLNNAVNVATNKTITVTFNEPIQAGTSYNNIQIINTSTNTAQTITKTINNNILTITSSAWAQGVLYTLTIPPSSITDLAGNNLTNTFTSNFTTINTTDTTPPTINNTDPANNTKALPTKIMTITFSEPIKAGSTFSSISMLNTYENESKDIVTSISGNTLTITPTYNWLPFVKYTLTIPANSITDLNGNNLLSDYITSFTCSSTG